MFKIFFLILYDDMFNTWLMLKFWYIDQKNIALLKQEICILGNCLLNKILALI